MEEDICWAQFNETVQSNSSCQLFRQVEPDCWRKGMKNDFNHFISNFMSNTPQVDHFSFSSPLKSAPSLKMSIRAGLMADS